MNNNTIQQEKIVVTIPLDYGIYHYSYDGQYITVQDSTGSYQSIVLENKTPDEIIAFGEMIAELAKKYKQKIQTIKE